MAAKFTNELTLCN